MNKNVVQFSPEKNLRRTINKVLRVMEGEVTHGKSGPEALFDAIEPLLMQYPSLSFNKDKKVWDNYNDVLGVLEVLIFEMLRKYNDGNKHGAYQALDLLHKSIAVKISQQWDINNLEVKDE